MHFVHSFYCYEHWLYTIVLMERNKNMFSDTQIAYFLIRFDHFTVEIKWCNFLLYLYFVQFWDALTTTRDSRMVRLYQQWSHVWVVNVWMQIWYALCVCVLSRPFRLPAGVLSYRKKVHAVHTCHAQNFIQLTKIKIKRL